jgi:hypothetical protein
MVESLLGSKWVVMASLASVVREKEQEGTKSDESIDNGG